VTILGKAPDWFSPHFLLVKPSPEYFKLLAYMDLKNPVAFLLLEVMYMNLKYSELFIAAQMKCNSSFPVVTKT